MIIKEKTGYINRVAFIQPLRLSLLNSEIVKEELMACFHRNTIHVVLDMGLVKYIDSSAIRMLYEVNIYTRKLGILFSLDNVSEDLKELLQLLNVYDEFHIYSAIDKAIII